MTKQTVDKALRAHLKARAKAGTAKYGVELTAFNGRKPAYDRLEELLDAAVYSMQDIMEREEVVSRLEDWARALEGSILFLENVTPSIVASQMRLFAAELRKDVGRGEPERKVLFSIPMSEVIPPPARIERFEDLYGPASVAPESPFANR